MQGRPPRGGIIGWSLTRHTQARDTLAIDRLVGPLPHSGVAPADSLALGHIRGLSAAFSDTVRPVDSTPPPLTSVHSIKTPGGWGGKTNRTVTPHFAKRTRFTWLPLSQFCFSYSHRTLSRFLRRSRPAVEPTASSLAWTRPTRPPAAPSLLRPLPHSPASQPSTPPFPSQ